MMAAGGLLAAVMAGLAQAAPGPSAKPSGPAPPVMTKNGEAWAWTQLVNGTSHSTEIRFATTEKPTGHCPTVQYSHGGCFTAR
ncbi:hypothetical protein [Spirillospora sp. CA-128828]|uniref:hypothetical protein n=1 Tax=Spirillospora sp. CA-128828 TaxID=3240033 RepID=UPI003D917DBB